MKNKGFTLLELLITVTIMGVLTGAAIPATTDALKKSRVEYCEANIDLVTASARDYFKDHFSLFPKQVGDTSEVSLEELHNSKYIDNIYDYNKEEINYKDSKIKVVRSTLNNYEYTYSIDYKNCNNYLKGNLYQKTDVKAFILFTPNGGSNYDNKDINVNITFDDKGVKVLSYKYEIYKVTDKGNILVGGITNYKDYKDKDINVKLNMMGTYFIKAYAINATGNLSEKQSSNYTLKYVLKTGSDGKCDPKSTIYISSNKEENVWSNGEFKFNIKKIGSVSSYDVLVSKEGYNNNVYYKEPFITKISKATSDKTLTSPSSESFIYTIYIVAYDEYGNSCTTREYKYYQDNIPPKCTTTSSHPNWTNKTVTLTGACDDFGALQISSKCKVLDSCSYDGAKNTSICNVINNDTNINSYFTPGVIYDNAGNRTMCDNIWVGIDIVNPTITCSANGSWNASGASGSVAASDDFSGFGTNPKGTKTGLKSTTKYTAIDKAGNSSSCSLRVKSATEYRNHTRSWNTCLTGSPNACQGENVTKTKTTRSCKYETHRTSSHTPGCKTVSNTANGVWSEKCYVCHNSTTTYQEWSNCAYRKNTCQEGWNPWGGWSGWGFGNNCASDTCEAESRLTYQTY